MTGDGPIELDGVTFKSSDLMVEPGRMITLPNSAVFDDAEISLGPLPETHPANAVALLTYTYNDRKIGEAFLLAKICPQSSRMTKLPRLPEKKIQLQQLPSRSTPPLRPPLKALIHPPAADFPSAPQL